MWKNWVLRKWNIFIILVKMKKENMVVVVGWFINLVMEDEWVSFDGFNFFSEVWGEVIILEGKKEREIWVG